MRPTVVLNVVGLAGEHLGDKTPNLTRLARDFTSRPLETVLPLYFKVAFRNVPNSI